MQNPTTRVAARLLSLLLLATPLALLVGCDEHHHESDQDVVIVDQVPAGGTDFGLMLTFDHDFATRDISDTQDLDGFEFQINQDSVVVITLTGAGGFDGFLDLYESDFHFVMGDDNGGPGNDAVLVGSLPAGGYFVVVGGSGGSTGSFDIDITIEPEGGADFGILAKPDSIVDSTTLTDAFDVDSYIFTVNASGILDVYLTLTSGNYDGNLQVLDEYGNELAYVDPVGLADPSALNIAITPGTYIVRVGASSGSGSYSVQVDFN